MSIAVIGATEDPLVPVFENAPDPPAYLPGGADSGTRTTERAARSLLAEPHRAIMEWPLMVTDPGRAQTAVRGLRQYARALCEFAVIAQALADRIETGLAAR